ncbi:MAG: S41 family peptidase, partial [Phycisphaerae bacterium]|nr:S41 family peptidase [Phycisphaerae bacterium]
SSYVKKPDYRKIGLAGLEAVRVLAGSSRAAETLDALTDEKKRLVFMEGVGRQVKHLKEIKETVDYLHVIEALNNVLDLNSETLGLPEEVVNMEFADGMLASLDKFTSMIWPYQEEEFRKRTMGSFYGIGVQIRKDPGRVIEVVTPLADAPALRAGIRAGDYIVRVGGADTRMMSLERAVKLITGPKGTPVTLTIRRAGRSKPFDVSITRDTIRIQTIKGWRRLPGGEWDFFLDPDERIGYIRLTQFTMDTAVELRRVLRSLRRAKPPIRGLIIDMRFNPGGLLSAAEDVSDEFLPRGLIVRIKERKNQSQKTATAIGEYHQGEIIVLVNQYSASASEIVAGALKDWGRARIIGQRTYGKGSVQRPMRLRSKRAKLKLTTAYYYLPSGRCLHRTNGAQTWGVDPDVSVKVTVHQMNRWAEIRQETDILKSIDAERLNGLLSKQLQEDIQLQTALLLMRLKLLAESQPAQPAKAA